MFNEGNIMPGNFIQSDQCFYSSSSSWMFELDCVASCLWRVEACSAYTLKMDFTVEEVTLYQARELVKYKYMLIYSGHGRINVPSFRDFNVAFSAFLLIENGYDGKRHESSTFLLCNGVEWPSHSHAMTIIVLTVPWTNILCISVAWIQTWKKIICVL